MPFAASQAYPPPLWTPATAMAFASWTAPATRPPASVTRTMWLGNYLAAAYLSQLIGDTCGRQLAFSSFFSFTLTRQAASGSEGFAVVVAFDSTLPTTPAASGMGYAGMGARSVAVEFDTSKDAGNSDPDSNHAGINIGGSVMSVVTAKPSFPLNDGKHKRISLEQ
ncbi:unnamed protein product [Closterium sp. NIES-65]|nr:unnamed protein product [Closterium sp. NIES-65]